MIFDTMSESARTLNIIVCGDQAKADAYSKNMAEYFAQRLTKSTARVLRRALNKRINGHLKVRVGQ